MENTSSMVIYALLLLALVPLFDAIIRKTKALLYGRKWPSFLQSYYDYNKLFQKQNFLSQFSSSVSTIAPTGLLVMSLVFFFLVTLSQIFSSHIFLLLFVVGISAFFLALYGMDNATYFGWLGASREMFVLFLTEPLFILSLWFLSYTTQSRDIDSLQYYFMHQDLSSLVLIQLLLFAIIFWYILVAENKRFPFDNPTTHLELTMIHEAMLLETTGPTLGMIELASKINLVAFISLFVSLLFPFDFGVHHTVWLFLLWIGKILLVCVFLGIRETYVTKLRIFRYPTILFSLLALEIIFIILHYIIT